jgi:hypothetical protein
MPVVGYNPAASVGADSGVNTVIDVFVPAGESVRCPFLHVYGMSRLNWTAHNPLQPLGPSFSMTPLVGFRARNAEAGDNAWDQSSQLVPILGAGVNNFLGVISFDYNTVVAEVMSANLANLGEVDMVVRIILTASA